MDIMYTFLIFPYKSRGWRYYIESVNIHRSPSQMKALRCRCCFWRTWKMYYCRIKRALTEAGNAIRNILTRNGFALTHSISPPINGPANNSRSGAFGDVRSRWWMRERIFSAFWWNFHDNSSCWLDGQPLIANRNIFWLGYTQRDVLYKNLYKLIELDAVYFEFVQMCKHF